MPNDFWVESCVLENFNSAEEFLKDVVKASGQSIKQHGLDKKWLKSPLKSKNTFKLPLALLNRHQIWPSFTGPQPFIISESEDFVAIHKPPAVHTHPLSYEGTANLLSWLVTQKRFDLLEVNKGQADRGCLYRLDGPTSGLVLYAKRTEIYDEVRKNFSTLFHQKTYLCIVRGNPGTKENVEHFLSPFGPKGAQMKCGHAGVRALLSYKTIKTHNDFSLVEVSLQTGHRHQIRVQMAELGFPILGDELYGAKTAARLFLHCYEYKMMWSGKELSWKDSKADLFESFFDLNSLL